MDTVLPHVSLSFARAPSPWLAYARALLPRPALAPPGYVQPLIEARLDAVRAAPDRVEAYRAVCGYAEDATMPLTFPHVLAMPLHLAILTAPAFPVRLIGLVHIANSITRLHVIDRHAAPDLRCALTAMRETARGQEFDLKTEALLSGERVWSETSTFLARRRDVPAREDAAGSAMSMPVGMNTSLWSAAEDVGRRYAGVSGDYNPIHLAGFSARLLGFPQAIAHGMWTLARTAATIEAQADRAIAILNAAFKLPVLLPSQVQLHTWDEGAGCAFALTAADGAKPHINGTARYG